MKDITSEISFKTARSGGKGGQHVNKVETMVEGFWHPASSKLLTDEEKGQLLNKLSKKLTNDEYIIIKSQVHKSQLANKKEVIRKFMLMVEKALIIPKKRKATKPTKASQLQKKESKQINAALKQSRKKIGLP